MDLLVVGSGFFGLTIAERAANAGRKVTVIDRRPHIGGNAYSEPRVADRYRGAPLRRAPLPHVEPDGVGVRQPLHVVHELRAPCVHHAQGHRVPDAGEPRHDQPVLPVRVPPDQARALVREQAGEFDAKTAANFEEKGIALVGRRCSRPSSATTPRSSADRSAEALRRHHQPSARALHLRQPLLHDTWEGLPTDGYTAWLERMADHPNIDVQLDVDFFDETQPLTRTRRSGRFPSCTRAPSTATSTTRRRAQLADAGLRAGGPRHRRLPRVRA